LQGHKQTLFAQFLQSSEVISFGYLVLEQYQIRVAAVQFKSFRQVLGFKMSFTALLDEVRGRCVYPAGGLGILIVVDNECRLTILVVGVGKHIFVDPSTFNVKIVQSETVNICKDLASVEQGEDHCLMMTDQVLIGGFIPVRTVVFHAIFFGITLNLTVTKHGQTGHC